MNKEENIRVLEFFILLMDRGILRFDGKYNDDFYFAKLDQEKGVVSVNAKKNEWFDHSKKMIGGMDEAVDYFRKEMFEPPLKQLFYQKKDLKHIMEEFEISTTTHEYVMDNTKDKIKIMGEFREIKHPVLKGYFNSKGFEDVTLMTGNFMKELHWTIDDKRYCGIGFPSGNRNGFKIWSPTLKMNIGDVIPKEVEMNKAKPPALLEKVKLFVDLFDFLSFFKLYAIEERYTAVILYSLSNFPYFINKWKKKSCEIAVFFNNDRAGRDAVQSLQKEFNNEIIDCSDDYNEHNSLNEKLIACL